MSPGRRRTRAVAAAAAVLCLARCGSCPGGAPSPSPGDRAASPPAVGDATDARQPAPSDGGAARGGDAETSPPAAAVTVVSAGCAGEAPPFGSVHETSCSRIKGSGVVAVAKTAGPAAAVTVRKGRAFVAVGAAGVEIFDVVSGGSPTSLARLDTPGTASWIHLEGEYAYVADGDAGLQVVDVSDPALPTLEGSLDTPGSALQVQVAQGHAFVCDGPAGVRIIDVSSPLAPVERASLQTEGPAWAVQVRGERAYVASSESDVRSQLTAYDVSSPATPRQLGSIAVELARAMEIHRDRAYVLSGDGVLHVVDLSDADALRLVTTVSLTSCGGCVEEGPLSLFASEGRLFVPGYYILDLATPERPRFLARGPATAARGFSVVGRRGYAAAGDEGLKVVSLNLGNLRLGRSFDSRGSGVAMELSGDRLYLARGPSQLVSEGEDGLDVFEVDEQGMPRLIGTLELDASVLDMALVETKLFLVVAPAEVRVIDVSNPRRPRETSRLALEGDAKAIAASGTHLYLTVDGEEREGGDRGQLVILDAADPRSMRRLGTAPLRQDAGAVLVHCGLAYVGFGIDEDAEGLSSGGIAVVDVSHPATPSLANEVLLGRNVLSMALRRPYLYAGLGSEERQEGDVHLLDVTDPRNPSPLSTVRAGGAVTDVRLAGGSLFAAVQPWGLLVADVTSPAAPTRLALVGPISPDPADHYLDAGGVAVRGGHAYLASDELHVVSLCSQ